MKSQTAQPESGKVRYHWPGRGCDPACQLSSEHFPSDRAYDVAIIGAGVVGCALAYVLSQYRLRIVIIDRAFDVGEGTSKGNSAIIHTGFDATPGSLESQLVTEASRQWPDLARKLKIPFQQVSALMLALNAEQLKQLPGLRDKAIDNGIHEVELVSAADVKRMEPHVSPHVLGGLLVPRESIVDPFTTSIAYAEVAVHNGVDVVFGFDVQRIDQPAAAIKSVVGSQGTSIPTRFVINAAGLGSRQLVEAYAGEPMDLNPRRGQFVVYDRDSSRLVSRILLPIPTQKTKGMLVSPTIFGNLLAGPTAEDLPADDIRATQTTPAGLAAVRENGIQMCPALSDSPVIAAYAGLRCHCAQGSYWMRFNDGHPGIVTLAGIRSTGLTSSIATAQYVVRHMQSACGLELRANETAIDSRPESRWPGWWRPPLNDPERLAANGDYGRIVCSCENISRGEVQDALESCSGTATLDGLKRRTRVLTGRCQGFNCCVPVARMISSHFHIPLAQVTKRGPGSEFIAGGGGIGEHLHPITHTAQQAVASRYDVVIVGAGPAGIGAAVRLGQAGIRSVLLVDRASQVGGIPARYEVKPGGVPTFVVRSRGRIVFGAQFVERIRRKLDRTETSVQLECQVIGVDKSTRSLTLVGPQIGKTEVVADAVIFACGVRERTRSERGWITGHRPAREFYTMQLLQLLDECQVLPMQRPAILGSDLVAYSAAAKLRAAGSQEIAMFDRTARPAAGFLERFYFGRWSRPVWHAAADGVTLADDMCVHSIQNGHQRHACDGVVISGDLVPNSELIATAGLDMTPSQRNPVRHRRNQLSEPGWFIAGSDADRFRSADWCYRDGRRAGTDVAAYLRRIAGHSR